MFLTRENIISLARLSEKFGFKTATDFFDKQLDEVIEIENIVKQDGLELKWRKDNGQVKDKIIEFKKEVDQDWARDRRLVYLEEKIAEVFQEKTRLEKIKTTLGKIFPWDNELAKVNRLYKNLYFEYATLNGHKKKDNGEIPQDEIERCRQVPVESLVETQLQDVGNGRKKTICPFHEEKDGSFYIFPDNSYHCFGCSKHGSGAISFIMESRNLDFLSAIDYLKSAG